MGTYVATGIATATSFLFSRYKHMGALQAAMLATVVAAATALLSQYMLFSITPEAMFQRAASILKKLESKYLLKIAIKHCDEQKIFIYKIYEKYLDEQLPLLKAFKKYIMIRDKLDRAYMLLYCAKQEGFKSSDDYVHYSKKVYDYMTSVDRALVIIRQDENWINSMNSVMLQYFLYD